MALLTDNEINEIRTSVDIIDIIGEHIPLIQKGRNYFGLCPFHDDHNPSMSVSKEKQIYKCFSCGASGNVINFVMDYNHKTFKEALLFLAAKSGLKIAKDIYEPKRVNAYEKLYDIYEISTKYYQNNINSNSGKKAKDYLSKRNIDEDIIKEFHIGLALDQKDNLTSFLLSKGFSEEEIVASGITNKSENGFQDVFLNRIMFPLRDAYGKVIGYSGRIYTDSDMAKYINTKETNIFKKGEHIYNYHRALNEVRKSKQVIVMEGFMDVIRSYSVNLKNVVSIMGTSITKEQVNLLKKLSSNIILCFDGDEAGQAATLGCAHELMKAKIEPKIVYFKEAIDPDDYIQKYGIEKFTSLIDNALSVIDFKLDYYKKGKDFTNADDLTKYINDIIIEISMLEDDIKREFILNKISKEYNLAKEILSDKLNKYLQQNKPTIKKEPVITKPKILNKYIKAERQILYYMLKCKEIVKLYEREISYLPTSNGRLLANEIINYLGKYEELTIADFITYLKDKEDLIKLIGELEMSSIKETYTQVEIEDYVKTLQEFKIQKEIERLKELLKNETDIMQKARYAEAIRKLKVEE